MKHFSPRLFLFLSKSDFFGIFSIFHFLVSKLLYQNLLL